MKKFSFFIIFSCLLLVTCGIPNYFYLGSSYVNANSSRYADDETVSVYDFSITLSDDFQLSKCKSCPSIFLFYFLDSTDYYSSTGFDDIYSRFSNYYGSISRKGLLINVSANEFTYLIPSYEHKFSEQDDSKIEVSIFNLAFADGRKISRPNYHIPIKVGTDLRPVEKTIQIRLSFDKQNRKLTLFYEYDTERGEYLKSAELVRADGSAFSVIPSNSDFSTYSQEHIDYLSVSPSSLNSIKLNVMGAVCASNGDFDNIYWTNLYKIASFNLTGGI